MNTTRGDQSTPMIAPHGGLKEPINRMVAEDRRVEFLGLASELPKLPVSDADLSSLYRFGDGGLSPLEGPMTKEVFDRVLDEEVIVREGEKYAWTIPIAFPASYEVADSLKVGQKSGSGQHGRRNCRDDRCRGHLSLRKARYLRSVYSTDRLDHPGVVWSWMIPLIASWGAKSTFWYPKEPSVWALGSLSARDSPVFHRKEVGSNRWVSNA